MRIHYWWHTEANVRRSMIVVACWIVAAVSATGSRKQSRPDTSKAAT